MLSILEFFDSCVKVLVLAPHGDDGELGCGGTMSRFIEEGCEVFYVCFSLCRQSMPEGFPENALEMEVKKATKSLGISPSNLIIYDYPVRTLHLHRQEILEKLIVLREEISPNIIFMPASFKICKKSLNLFN